MLITSLFFIAFSGGTGFTLAVAIFSKKAPPTTSVFMHGLLSSIGLTLVAVFCVANPLNFPALSLISFLVTAFFGFYMFRNNFLKKKPGPRLLVILHIFFAALAFGLLAVFVFQK